MPSDAGVLTSDEIQAHEHGRGYIPISDHALIGNLRTAALISLDGSVESYCVPNFDSPSVFARILDKDKGGHFSIRPHPSVQHTVKQNYLPSSNVLSTRYLCEEGVATVTDFMPRVDEHEGGHTRLCWLVRRVEVIRGKLRLRMECAPAFDYARVKHSTDFVPDTSVTSPKQRKVVFKSDALTLDLRYISEGSEDVPVPHVSLSRLDLQKQGHLGMSAYADMELSEGQSVTFVLRHPPDDANAEPVPANASKQEVAQNLHIPEKVVQQVAEKLRPDDDPLLTLELLKGMLKDTNDYWHKWIAKSTYKGRWRENVNRSALALKLLIYEKTGAIVASPTFSLPEHIGGSRNWDYRYSWIRDSSFTLYALLRLGFTAEAQAYSEFVFGHLQRRNKDGSLNIMYTIHGGRDIKEEELKHLDGHKGSKPVRIGNGAVDHVQLDIYGELLDCVRYGNRVMGEELKLTDSQVYLCQKYGRPLSYETWVGVRELVDYVLEHVNDKDLSIWEVRSRERNFTYSKVMIWVAIDRGLRLAEKRSLPCPRQNEWLAARDRLYEDIMKNAWNAEGRFFAQSYEDKDILDSAVMIMPMVFFAQPTDNRFIQTLDRILTSRRRGGLTTNGLVYRYDPSKVEDGIGGEEGTFCLCTLWCVEALTRVGAFDPVRLDAAVRMFEDMLMYDNHVGLWTEEIGPSGEGLGNAVQAFTHVTLISAAYNLNKTLDHGPIQ